MIDTLQRLICCAFPFRFFRPASILDESGDSTGLIGAGESTIKLESSSGGSVSGAAAIAAYYCNSYPLTTSSPGLVTAVSSADRNSSMLVSGTYSKWLLIFLKTALNNLFAVLLS